MIGNILITAGTSILLIILYFVARKFVGDDFASFLLYGIAIACVGIFLWGSSGWQNPTKQAMENLQTIYYDDDTTTPDDLKQ